MPNIIPFPRRRRWTGPADYGRGEPARIRSTRWTRFAPLWLGAILLGLGYGSGTFSTGPQQALGAASLAGPVRATFGYCYIGGGTNCVVDGDTFWINGEKVRIAGIDAPETHPSRCAEEARLGQAATQKLHELLNSGAVTMTTIDATPTINVQMKATTCRSFRATVMSALERLTDAEVNTPVARVRALAQVAVPATRFINRLKGGNRLMYDVTSTADD